VAECADCSVRPVGLCLAVPVLLRRLSAGWPYHFSYAPRGEPLAFPSGRIAPSVRVGWIFALQAPCPMVLCRTITPLGNSAPGWAFTSPLGRIAPFLQIGLCPGSALFPVGSAVKPDPFSQARARLAFVFPSGRITPSFQGNDYFSMPTLLTVVAIEKL
jgi:hypothetical protein